MTRVLETVLTGRNLLSPVLTTAARDVEAFNVKVTAANDKAGVSATASARAQQVASATIAAANREVSSSAMTAANTQRTAAASVEAANARVARSATTSAATQSAASEALAKANVAGGDAAAVAAAIIAAANGDAATSAAESSESQQASFSDVQDKVADYADKVKEAHAGVSGSAADGAAVTEAANARSAASTAESAAAQGAASEEVVAANAVATRSTTTSSERQVAAHRATAESATLAARAQESASAQLAASNGLIGASLSPLLKGLGVVGLGLAYAAYRSMDFGAAMSQVQAASQASAADMKRLRDAAIDQGAKTKYSSEEAAQGITEMAKAGVSTTDILSGGLAGALNLAAAGEISVADAAETGATALSVFGLKGDQMSHVADLLAAGAGKAQGSVGDLSQALNQSALVANQTGLSVEDTAGALAMFASNGLTGSDAGTSFKTMLQALNPNSDQAAKLMDQLGLRAYDAQGNFVGLAAYADQLKAGLSGLSVEQQNAALKTIFGSDAVRAASVLYKEGGAGVREWAGNVNDAGYAVRQASQLQDNLKGDLEKLGGAFDSTMTTIGGGTQGALRELVQALTGIIDVGGDVIGFFSSLPGPIQAGVLALAGLVMLRGPIDTMFTRLAVGLTSTVTGMGLATGATSGFTLATGAARIAVAGLVSAAAPLAAIVAAGYAVKQVVDFAHAGDDAKQSVEQLESSIKSAEGNGPRFAAISSGIDDLKKKLTDTKQIVDSYEGQNWFNQNVWTNPFGSEMEDAKDAKESIGALSAEIDNLQAAQTRGQEAAAAIGQQFHLTSDQVLQLADKYKIDLTQGVDAASNQFLIMSTAQDTQSASSDGASGSATVLADQLQNVADAADNSKKQIDLYKTSLDVLNGAHLTEQQAESDFYAAIDAADGALKNLTGRVLDNTGALDLHTESGRKTQDVLFGVRDSANQYIATLIEQGATSEEANAKDAELRDSFYNTALQMTGSKKAAEDLTNQIYGIPAERTTQINADTSKAVSDVANVQLKIDQLHGATIKIQAQLDGGGGLYLPMTSQRVPGLADGGYTGPGGKYEVAPFDVHRGEIVWSQDDVAAHGGVGAVESMRQSRPGYADGGIVGGPTIVVDSTAANTTAKQAIMALRGTGGYAGGGGGAMRDLGRQIAAAMGFGGQFAAIDSVFTRESGWNPNAQNPTSTAYGIPQFLNSTWAAYGGKTSDPSRQIRDGIQYMVDRYGSPAGANAFWNAHHWYDEGGLANRAGYLAKATVEPERVLSPRQTEAFEQWMTSPAAMPGYGPAAATAAPVIKVSVPVSGARVTGRLEVDASGFATLVNATVDLAFADVHDSVHYAIGG